MMPVAFKKRKEKRFLVKTTWLKKEDIKRQWYLVDLNNQVLGRAATKIASLLRGKDKVDFVPNFDCGDYVVVINAQNVKLTGNKLTNKIYYNHSGWKGGLRSRNAATMQKRYPVEMVERAIKGMLQHNKLGRVQFKKLFVFPGEEHNLSAQKLIKLDLEKGRQ